MNCTNCGARLLPGAQFCGACGTRVTNPPGGTSAAPNQPDAFGAGPAESDFSGGGMPGDAGARGDVFGGPPGAGGAGASPGGGYGAGQFAGGGAQGANQGIHIDEDARGQGRGYSYEVLHQPSFALAVLKLQPEQSIQAEAGAMVSMSANIELQSQMKGGLLSALKRTVGGESAFVSTFTARGGPGEVTLAPGGPGDIAALELRNQLFFVQSSSYLGGDIGLQVDTRWGGAKSFFGGEGLFVLQVGGTGLLLVSSFGAIHRKRLGAGERYVVDTGHLVAWEGGTQYTLRKAASGFFRSMVSGEGIVAEFTGPGEILIQTRNLAAFAGLMRPFFPSQGGSGGGFNFGG